MSDKKINLDSFIGEELTSDFINDLLTGGNLSQTFKDTIPPSHESKSSDESEYNSQEDEIEKLVNTVKENEDLIKQLEDLRDTLLADMKIPGEEASDSAKKLGSKNGDITFDTYKRAKQILSPELVSLSQTGNLPAINALGGSVDTSGLNNTTCNNITDDIYKQIKVTLGNSDSDNGESNPTDNLAEENIKNTKDNFKEKMKLMFIQIFGEMWWENIYPRVVMLIVLNLQVLIKHIDTPFCLFRFKIPNKANLEKYGPMHRLLKSLVRFLLCKLPCKLTNKGIYNYEATAKIKIMNTSVKDWCKGRCGDDNDAPCGPSCSDDCEHSNEYASGDDFDKDDNPGDHINETSDKMPCNTGDDINDDHNESTGFIVSTSCYEAALEVMNKIKEKSMEDGSFVDLEIIKDYSKMGEVTNEEGASGIVT